ncbi:MAG TPA: hypothetical protein PLZ32_02035 [Saprospiraceae bacterium]|nr:hypothetical protein [Saprospiraceae bacterium]
MQKNNFKKIIIYPFIVCSFLCLSFSAAAQTKVTKITWKTLSDVYFKEEYNKEFDFNVMVPVFGASVKSLEGKIVEIEGYTIPIDEVGYENMIVLSAVPYSQCFFCGLSGPESVMDIKPKQKIKGIKVDKKLRFKGKLKLNSKDMSQLNYILTEAELVNP